MPRLTKPIEQYAMYKKMKAKTSQHGPHCSCTVESALQAAEFYDRITLERAGGRLSAYLAWKGTAAGLREFAARKQDN